MSTGRSTTPGGAYSFAREGFGWLQRDAYHYLLDASRPKLVAILLTLYLAGNALFAAAYLLEPGAIENARPGSFADAFFFSVQTMATIGYGKLVPATTYANLLVVVETSTGILGLAMLTGLIFAKFSRRHTYTAADIVWGARFADVVTRLPDGGRRVDLAGFHDVVEDATGLPPWLTRDGTPA